MQPRPNVAFCPVCRTAKGANEVTCGKCGTRSCPSGHVIDSRICRRCGFEDRSWKPQAKEPSLGATIIRSPGIPEVKEGVCPRCKVKTLFTYGRCHNCGFILESGQRLDYHQEGEKAASTADTRSYQSAPHYVVQQQFPGTYDAKLSYLCPNCGTKADPRAGGCHNCGYRGPLTYEMRAPAPDSPPAAPAKALPKEPSLAGQQFSHPQEPLRSCPSCGAAIPADSRYCRQCGFYSGPSRHIGAQGYIIGSAEKTKVSSPLVTNQMTPSMEAAPAGGVMAQDYEGSYAPQGSGLPAPEIGYPEQKVKVKEKKERFPQEGKRFPTGLLVAVFIVAGALVAMVMFTISQILAPPATPPTPIADKTPPEITGVTISTITASSATIEWTTNEKATSQIMLCEPSGVCTYSQPDATLVKAHSVVVNDTKLNIKYHITVKSIDASGNEGAFEMDQTFTQTAQPPPTPAPPSVPEGIEVGKRAIDFKLKNLQGSDVTLRSYQGKLVMVNFWAVTCIPCVAELPDVEAVYKARSAQLVVLAINAGEGVPTVQSFINSTNFTFPVLLDSEGTVRNTYNVTSWPRTFFIDTSGVIRHIKIGQFANKAEIENVLNTLH